jgi:hypothetical protein
MSCWLLFYNSLSISTASSNKLRITSQLINKLEEAIPIWASSPALQVFRIPTIKIPLGY